MASLSLLLGGRLPPEHQGVSLFRIVAPESTVHRLKIMLRFPWKLIRNLGNVLEYSN